MDRNTFIEDASCKGKPSAEETLPAKKTLSVEETPPVEEALCRLLMDKGLTLSTAESCTGGLISSKLVNVPGVSAVFLAGFITYANCAKQNILQVKAETLEIYGAVSEQTAQEMALGAVAAASSDCAISVTGIAGPEGGSDRKPVGLVYIGSAVRGKVVVREYHFQGNRSQIREASATAALEQLIHCIHEFIK